MESALNAPAAAGIVLVVVAIICATIAVCLGQIDGQAYSAIVAAGLGLGGGAGAHAAGVKQGTP